MAQLQLEELDSYIESLRERLQSAERIRKAVAADPDLLKVLGSMAVIKGADNGTARGVAKKAGRPKKPGREIIGGPRAQADFQKVADHLLAGGNEPQRIPAITKATGMKRAAVIQVFYRTHGPLFVSERVPDQPSRKQWRLRKDWKERLAASRKAGA
jgi:hypothetical protein